MKKGFTLIEMLVAMSIFVIAVLTIAGIFMTVSSAQRKSKIEQRVQAEARYALELLAREVRDGWIDYDGYGGSLPANENTILRLVRRNGDRVEFKLASDGLKMNMGGIDQSITGGTVKVENLKFYITPASNPFEIGGGASNEQPRVTISFVVRDKNATKAEERAQARVQTTASSRMYKR